MDGGYPAGGATGPDEGPVLAGKREAKAPALGDDVADGVEGDGDNG